jgi:hypothetical protein
MTMRLTTDPQPPAAPGRKPRKSTVRLALEGEPALGPPALEEQFPRALLSRIKQRRLYGSMKARGTSIRRGILTTL